MNKIQGPASIGIIMDGNRRWAKEQGLPSFEGHRQGAEKLREVLAWANEQSIQHTIVYAFSTENWKRDGKEVEGLIRLLGTYVLGELRGLKDTTSIRFIGQIDRFPESVQQDMRALEEETKDNEKTLSIAISYGGRADILHAANTLIKKGYEVITEELLTQELLTRDVPDPDLIIRTGGEQRLSNFLTWQSVYSELVFTDTFWPALGKDEFDRIIETYRERKRNFGV